MFANLTYGLMETMPKKGMIVEIENHFYQINTYINRDTKDVECISLEDGRSIINISYQDAYKSICKFIATYKSNGRDVDCSVCHTSNTLLVRFLDTQDSDGIENWTKLRNKIELRIEGNIESIPTKVGVNTIVQITEIGIIDRYKLYDPSTRICTIKEVSKFEYKLFNSHLNTDIICRRRHFKSIDNDQYYLFKLKCDTCNR